MIPTPRIDVQKEIAKILYAVNELIITYKDNLHNISVLKKKVINELSHSHVPATEIPIDSLVAQMRNNIQLDVQTNRNKSSVFKVGFLNEMLSYILDS